MKAIILVGGAGTRLRPVTYEIPKPLVTVKKKPIVNHLIEFFARYGINEVALIASVAHETDFMRWKDTWGRELPIPIAQIDLFFEDKPRGTFGMVPSLRNWIGDKDFVLSNGDELKDLDLSRLIAFHEAQMPLGTIALVKVEKPQEYGVPVMKGDYIMEFLEKPENPPSDYVSSGLYVLSPKIIDYSDPKKEFVMIEKDIFPVVAKENKLAGVKFDNARWYDCGSLERWEKAIKEW
jgi:NDP-sugar pyrophosphorylase family protein